MNGIQFTAYKSDTGEILYSGTADNPMELERDGVSVLLEAVGVFPGYVKKGVVHPLPSKPSEGRTFDFQAKEWVDTRTLAQVRDAKWSAIKLDREAAISAVLNTPYGQFDCGPKDRTNITNAVLMLQTLEAIGSPATIDFTLADNTTATLTTAQMVTVGLLFGQKVQVAYGTGRLRRAAIEAAKSVAQVEAVTWA